NETANYTREELRHLINQYKQKVKDLKKINWWQEDGDGKFWADQWQVAEMMEQYSRIKSIKRVSFGDSLYHGTNLEGHLAIQKSKYLGYDYGWTNGIHLTDDFNKAFTHGLYIYEFDLPFQDKLIRMIPNTDTGERELWLDFNIPIHRIKKVHVPNIDYDVFFMSEICGLTP
ncbi:MAG: hypothetical protein CMB97_08080, partial [Flavobacteriaceae bacterium]|nr:hypothetical protein [Flavobacteriaceae bacterium]